MSTHRGALQCFVSVKGDTTFNRTACSIALSAMFVRILLMPIAALFTRP